MRIFRFIVGIMRETIYNKTYKLIIYCLYIISYHITHFSLPQVQTDMKNNIKIKIQIGGKQNPGKQL